MALNMHEKRFAVSKSIPDCKKLKYESFCASKLLIWRQKWAAGVRYGNSLVVCRVSPGRIIVGKITVKNVAEKSAKVSKMFRRFGTEPFISGMFVMN